MADPIALRVLTSEGVAVEDAAASIIAPGAIGYLGILKNHAPLVTTLQPGTLTWRHAGGSSRTLRIGAGLLEVERNRVTVLTERVTDVNLSEVHG